MAYKPDQTPNDISVIGAGVHKVYDEVLVPAGMGDVAIYTEMGRFMMAPYGCLVTKAIHEKHIYKEYIGSRCVCGKPYETGYLRLIPSYHSARQGGCTL